LYPEGVGQLRDKQHFLNTVYERFFQGDSVKTADTHGIVYTPQPIVDSCAPAWRKCFKANSA
jgi:predicted helicase